MVSPSVVQTVGDAHCACGFPLTGRGAGMPVRPPVVWTNLAPVPVTSGSAFSSGNSAGWKTICATGPSLTRVLHM